MSNNAIRLLLYLYLHKWNLPQDKTLKYHYLILFYKTNRLHINSHYLILARYIKDWRLVFFWTQQGMFSAAPNELSRFKLDVRRNMAKYVLSTQNLSGYSRKPCRIPLTYPSEVERIHFKCQFFPLFERISVFLQS